MFDNVLHQSAASLLSDDLARGTLPGSILFSGPPSSAKLTAALELSRVLSCQGTPRGAWSCTCSSCMRHKALVSPSVLLMGPGNRTLELMAARDTLLSQYANNGSHLDAARYLYVRAVRKLTMRFAPVLWQDDDKLQKFSPLLQSVEESLELLSPGRRLPDEDELEKLLDGIEKSAAKLEGTFLYASLPVSQIRAASAWAHLSSSSGKKVLVIENADRMADSARNALLKILEEPPEDCQFILTTANRSALLPTILSRVRTYSFFEREAEHQREVISRVFHYTPYAGEQRPDSIELFLQGYLPVKPGAVMEAAEGYFRTVANGHVPDLGAVMEACGAFEPRMLFGIFLKGIVAAQKNLSRSAAGCEASAGILCELRRAGNNVSVYNQPPVAALENLARSLMQINYVGNGILKEAL